MLSIEFSLLSIDFTFVRGFVIHLLNNLAPIGVEVKSIVSSNETPSDEFELINSRFLIVNSSIQNFSFN